MPTTPTRRAALRGLGLTSIAAGVAATSALAAPAPAAAPNAADAELIRLCGEIDEMERRVDSHYEGGSAYIDDDDDRDAALEPLNGARSHLVTVISGIPARTYAGLVAKLRSFVVYDREETINLGGSSDLGETILASACRDALAFPNAAGPAVAIDASSNPDAELIATCDRLVQLRTRELAQFKLIDYDNNDDPLFATPEWDALAARLNQIGRPLTLAGAAAMARCVVRHSDRCPDGEIVMIDLAEWMAIRVSEFLAGSVVA